MGIIDPMVVQSAAATGVLEFGTGPLLWWTTMGLLAALAGAIGVSGLHPGRLLRLKPPKLVHAQLATVAVGRAK
jgi:hypothetical protein